ncbi:uncharacterized protein LOC124954737 isoform X1 [Vespa velutina]|uniref:uncharacterized protein LOC124954737 isoform X1 n=1 Tax=Vespa velutina TaxID=202808 RepID=UPI001FB32070|nr:uncharacterized protein LOC124954737 isoform X1 [Vespa velutina]
MGKLGKDIALLNRNNKKKIGDYKKQEIKPKRKKRKKDLEKLHRNALEASKDSLIGIYRNGAKGKEVRKGKLTSNKFYKARVQGEIAKFLDQDSSEKSEDVLELSPNTVRVNCNKKERLFERIVSSDEEIHCQKRISKGQLIENSRKFSWSAMYRYEELCAIICSENFDDQNTTILPDLPDPILKVKENLKHMHADAMRQHFSRPDVNINDYFNDLKNENTFKSSINGNDNKNVLNIQSESYISSDHSESLTADIVEDSHFEISPKFHREVDNKTQLNNILFSVPKKVSKDVKKMNVDRSSKFHLPSELFDRPISTITSSTDDENKKEINCQRCAIRNLNNVKRNVKFEDDDEFLIKNNQKYQIYQHRESNDRKDIPEYKEDNNCPFIRKSPKANIPVGNYCIERQKFIEDFVKDRRRRHRIRESNNIHEGDICTNLNDRTMVWKATKNLKHVPAILRRSVCDPTNITDLTHLLNGKCSDAYFKEPSKRNLDSNLNICSSLSSNDNSIIKTQFVKSNKCLENRRHTMPLKEQSSSTDQTVDFCIPIEMNIKKNKNKVNLNKDPKKSRKTHKSVTFSKGILLNGDASMQSHYSQDHDKTQPTGVHRTTDINHSKHCQILRQEIQNDNQSLLLKSTKPDRIYQPEVTFINPSQCDKYITTQNCQDNNESKPIYFQIINQSMKSSTEQKLFNQDLITKSNNLTAYEQTLSGQSMIQQSDVPITSQNVQFMFRENDPHIYAFSELQNLKLLTLNDSQNTYVSSLNSVHEQKRANECAIISNTDQPTKYLAIEKDLNTQRIPIYFHNNDKSINQQYMPCKVITAVEKQNNDKLFFHEPTSQVILLQGNHINDRNRQFVD